MRVLLVSSISVRIIQGSTQCPLVLPFAYTREQAVPRHIVLVVVRWSRKESPRVDTGCRGRLFSRATISLVRCMGVEPSARIQNGMLI